MPLLCDICSTQIQYNIQSEICQLVLSAGYNYSSKHKTLVLINSQQVYSNYELGQRDIPTDILIKLSNFYDVSVDYILGISNVAKIQK